MTRTGDVDPGGPRSAAHQETVVAATTVVVRRNAGFAALVGAGASAVAIAYLWRATQSGAASDWALCVVMAGLAVLYLANLVDARTPLLVADDLGFRIRLGRHWRGLPWDAVDKVVVQPRRGPVKDGRLLFAPHRLSRALEGLDSRGRRAAALNQKLYGAALAVPIGMTTRASAQGQALGDDLAALAQGRAAIVVEPLAPPDRDEQPDEQVQDAPVPDDTGTFDTGTFDTGTFDTGTVDGETVDSDPLPRRSLLGGLGTVVSRVAKGRSHDVDVAPTRQASVALGQTRRALRAEVTRDTPATVLSAVEPVPASEPPVCDTGRVRPIATLGEPVDPLVIDDFVTEPAYDPVIGPEIAAARTRVGLSVDELSERTRIRPHVIESIEVDDFAPCGGDFYARGHLRTLARVLGKDPAPMLEQFDRRYATAPVSARRVFEAELSTGMTGSMRSTVGSPNWTLLVGVVLALVMTWGVMRLFATAPPELLQAPAPVLNGSAGLNSGPDGGADTGVDVDAVTAPTARPVRVTLIGARGGSRAVLRDRAGNVVWAGDIVLGERRTIRATPPVSVRARNAGALRVSVNGRDRGSLGELDQPARRTFQRPR